MSRFIKCFALFLCCAAVMFAQFSASLQGTVEDPSGGIVPGAQVSLKNNGTGATQQTVANDQGFYRFNQLASGAYTVTVSANGFDNATVAVQLAADVAQSANATLQPASVQSTTTVTASVVPTLQTADASISGTVTSAAIEQLPTFGRDPYELVRTMPGINGTGGRSGTGLAVTLGNTTGPGGSNTSIFQTENQVQISSSGQRVEQNVFLLDGVSINSLGWGGAAVVTPNSESLADMTVVSTDYAAEDGRDSGAQIKMTSKSGTNEIHGSGVFLYQDPNFNAYNKWGGPSGGVPTRVENNFRQYAASLGGPIVKNRAFLFLSYEGLHNKYTTYGNGWVTTPQYRQLVAGARPNGVAGHIFSTANANPRILNPLNSSCNIFANNAAAICRQVPGGLDVGSPGPGVAGTPYYPIPPAPGSIGGGFDGVPDLQYVQYYLPNEQIGNQLNGRFDFNLTSKDLLFASAYVTRLSAITSDGASAGAPDADVRFKPMTQTITAAWIRNITATSINELRGNFTRFADNGVSDNPGINWGIPRVQVEAYTFGNIQVAGAPRSGDTPSVLAQNTYEVRDTFIKVLGNHTLRVGGQFRWEQDNNNLFGGDRPLYSFSGLWNLANDAPIYEAISADVSTGGPGNAARYFRDRDDAVFVQDDWHVNASLTLNLGVRWEYFSPLTEARDNLSNLFLYATGPNALANAAVRPVKQFWNPNYADVMPKIGFAYAPTSLHEKFVMRGGFGITYNRQNDNIFANSRENNPNNFGFNLCCGTSSTPFNGGQIQFRTATGTAPNTYPANPFLAVGVNPVTGIPSNATGVGPTNIEVYGAWPHNPDAYTFLYSFETQTQLANNFALIIGYQGAGSRHLIRLVNQNFLYANAVGTASAPVYQSFIPTPDVNANYNALNVRISRTFSSGFSADATYTWSKSIDMLSAEGPGAGTNQTDPVHAQTTEYGPSDYDSRHRFTGSGLWRLPIFPHNKGLLHTLLGGWQVGGILTAYSGFPWTPVTGTQQSIAAVTSAATIAPTRPVGYFGNATQDTSNSCLINGCEFGGVNGTVPIVGTKYFDISHTGPPGIGRNSFRGPRYFSTDASIAKRFGLPFINEAAGLELRGYAFNVFNQLNLQPFQFGAVDNNTRVENPNFGRPDGALAGRSVELQARFTF